MSVDAVRLVCTIIEVVAAIVVVRAFTRALGSGSFALYLRSVGMAMLLLTLAGRSAQRLSEPATWALVMVAVSLLILLAGYLLQNAENASAVSTEAELRAEVEELRAELSRLGA